MSRDSADELKDILNAVREDVRKIREAQPKLKEDRRQDVQAANDAFQAQLKAVAADLAQTRSLSSLEPARDAVAQLADSYQRALSTTCP